MRSRFRLGTVLFAIVSMIGCSAPGPTGVKRDKLYKVTGTLKIDGEPQTQVDLKLVRIGAEDPNAGTSKYLTTSARTDEKGNFSFGTYEHGVGDGAPPGEYVVLIQWGQMSLMTGQYSGDKLKGRYTNPEKSEIKLKVVDKPVDMGVVEVTTK